LWGTQERKVRWQRCLAGWQLEMERGRASREPKTSVKSDPTDLRVTHPLTGRLVSITLFFPKKWLNFGERKKRKQAIVERSGESDQQKLAKKLMTNRSCDIILLRARTWARLGTSSHQKCARFGPADTFFFFFLKLN
jgi:hypothetical protein